MTLQYARRYIDPRDQYRRWIDPRVRTLRLAEVIGYLLREGWKELPADRPGYRAFQEPEGATLGGRPLCQFVPDSEEDDLPLRMFELITGIAEVENRPAAEVIDAIRRPPHTPEANGVSQEQSLPAEPCAPV